jgi:hypothetical protein
VEVVQVSRTAALSGGLALAGALALGSCADPSRPAHYLEGSLGQLMDLGYDRVRVQLAPDDVSLLFVRVHQLTAFGDAGSGGTAGTSEDYPFRVGLLRWGRPLDAGVEQDLSEDGGSGTQRATFSRDVLNDPRKQFPPCRIGGLRFDADLVPGTSVSGDFHVTFENGIETASGRTVFDSFTAEVVQ